MVIDSELAVKLRDAHQMIVDAWNSLIEGRKSQDWIPENIKWIQTPGTRGPYERYPAEGKKIEVTVDYKNLLLDLKEHRGKLTRNGYFYWVFSDAATIGRKTTK